LIQSFVGFYPRYWFIGTYLGLYLISPIINIPLKTATKEQKIGYITILGLISFWLGWAGGQHTMADGKNITNLIFLYYIGNFLHYNIDHNKIQSGKWRLLLVYIVLNAGLIVTFLFTGKFELFQKILFKVFFPYNSPGVIMNAILCFLLFSTIKIQSSKINWAASSVLSIYLIHRGLLMGFLRKSVVYIKEITSGFLPVLGLFILAICIACIIIDKLIEPIQKHIGKMMYNRMGLCKIDDILKTISDGKICQKYY
jgi:surface polysaccharide O-acyltransferase-like enzyme